MSREQTHVEAQPIFRQMLDLLEELSELYTRETDDTEDDDAESMTAQELIDGLMEDAVERGLDEEHAERVVRAMLAMAMASSRS